MFYQILVWHTQTVKTNPPQPLSVESLRPDSNLPALYGYVRDIVSYINVNKSVKIRNWNLAEKYENVVNY